MPAAARTDVRCHALSDEEVPASGCLYITYQNFLLHDEIIRGPSCRERCCEEVAKALHVQKENSKHFPYLWYNLLRLLIYIQPVCTISFNVLHADAKWRLQKVQQFPLCSGYTLGITAWENQEKMEIYLGFKIKIVFNILTQYLKNSKLQIA